MEKDGVNKLQSSLDLKTAEKEALMSYRRGNSMLISGTDKIEILTKPSEYEFECLKDQTS